MKKLSLELCKARHNTPAKDGAIFENEVNPLNPAELETIAYSRLKSFGDDVKYIDLYVTGLTVALIATLNACKRLDIKVTLKHFDRITGMYYSQEVR